MTAPLRPSPPARATAPASIDGEIAGEDPTAAEKRGGPGAAVAVGVRRPRGLPESQLDSVLQIPRDKGVEIMTEAANGARGETDGDDSEGTDEEVETMAGTGARDEVRTDGELETTNGAPQTGSGVRNDPAATADLLRTREESLDPQEALNKSLAELKNACNVLAIDYEGKLLEFGTKIEKERVDNAVKFLKDTMTSNFKKLQITANKLLEAWKAADTPVARMSSFAWVLAVRDASGPDKVTGKGYLATSCVRDAEKEVVAIQKEMVAKSRCQYIAQRKKLVRILSDCHLLPADVGFDPHKAVDPARYKLEKQCMKNCIWELKKLLPGRKELVLRVELAQKAVKKKRSLPFCEALIEDARKTVLAMKKTPESEVFFDGLNVDDVLDGLEQASNALELARQQLVKKKSEQVTKESEETVITSKTRSGRVIPGPSN